MNLQHYPYIKNLMLGMLFLAFNFFHAGAQITRIRGTAEGAENKKIILKTYSDLFSMRAEKLSEALTDSNGRFSLSCWLPSPVLASFEIEYFKGSMYLQPGNTYTIRLTGIGFSDKADMVNHYLEPSQFGISIDSCPADDINLLISAVNDETDAWLEKNLRFLQTRRCRQSLDSLELSWDTIYGESAQSFIRQFVRYRLASLKYQTAYAGESALLGEYYFRQAVLYDNPEYASLLQDITGAYFYGVSNRLSISDFYLPVNKNNDYREFMDVLGKDSLFVNEVFRELVALSLLSQLYFSRDFSPDALNKLLTFVAENSKFERHRKIAANLLFVKNRFKPGATAPDFQLKGDDGKDYKLSGFRGKPVILAFFTSWCTSCLGEMEVMKAWHNKYGDKVFFLAVSADREYMKMYHFARERKYPFLLLHTNSDYEIIEDWGVFQYPHFVFVDENGLIIKNPLPLPSAGGEQWIRDFTGSK